MTMIEMTEICNYIAPILRKEKGFVKFDIVTEVCREERSFKWDGENFRYESWRKINDK